MAEVNATDTAAMAKTKYKHGDRVFDESTGKTYEYQTEERMGVGIKEFAREQRPSDEATDIINNQHDAQLVEIKEPPVFTRKSNIITESAHYKGTGELQAEGHVVIQSGNIIIDDQIKATIS